MRSVFASVRGSRHERQLPRLRLSLGRAALIVLATLAVNGIWLGLALILVQLFDSVVPQKAVPTLLQLTGLSVMGLLLVAALSYLRATAVIWQQARQNHRSAEGNFASHPSGAPMPVAETHVSQFDRIATPEAPGAADWLRVAVELPFAVVFLWLVHAFAGWIVAIPVAFGTGLLMLAAARARSVRKAPQEGATHEACRTAFVIETLGRINAIKAGALEAPMMRRFERLIATAAPSDSAGPREAAIDELLRCLTMRAGIVGVALAGSHGLALGTVTPGALAACLLLTFHVTTLLDHAKQIWVAWVRAGVRGESPADAADQASPNRPPAILRQPLRGDIALQGVTIRNAPDQPPLLDQVWMTVPAGAMIGITGAAGSGKTALLMAIAGQLRPETGRVLLDGKHDPAAICSDDLLQQVVYVPSRAPIYAGTLLENITMFAEASAMSPARNRDRAHDLAERLGLAPLAGCLPNGFNTLIGPGTAYSLPDGLAQRVALARAFHAAPRILLFDAANTALDAEGDAMVRRLLDEERGTCTMLIVSQRPSLLRLADEVYALSGQMIRATNGPDIDVATIPGACA